MKSALEFIKEKKFLFQPTFDRRLRRFDRNGKVEAGWAIGKVIKVPSGDVEHLCFGDFATGERFNWYSRKVTTKADQALIDAALLADTKAYQEEKNAIQRNAKLRVTEIWNALPPLPIGLTPYAVAKGLSALHGARVNASGELIVPMRDVHGALWDIQRISSNGSKGFFKGGKILGNFFQIGEITEEGRIYVCEGYATGVSIYEALGTLKTGGLRPSTGTSSSHARNVVGEASEVRQAPDAMVEASLSRSTELPDEQNHDPRVNRRAVATCPDGITWEGELRSDTLYAIDRRGLADVDSGQPRAVGHEVLEVRATRRPLAPPPDAGLAEDGDAGQRSPGRRAVGNGLAEHSKRPEGAGSEVLNESSGGERRSSGSRAPDSPHGTGPLSLACGPSIPHEQALPAPGGSDRDRARRRSALAWKPGEQCAGQVGIFPTGISRRGDDSQALRPPRPCVVVAFNTANLSPVVKELRQAYPRSEIVICADEDIWGEPAKGAAPSNPGRAAAEKAARTHGCKVVSPRFDRVHDSSRLRPTDFNDMACLLGLQAVGLEIESQLTREVAHDDTGDKPLKLAAVSARLNADGTQLLQDTRDEPTPTLHDDPVPFDERYGHATGQTENGDLGMDVGADLCVMSAKGTPSMPKHQTVVNRMIHVYGDRLIKQDTDVFWFTGTHWKHLTMGDIDRLQLQMQGLCGDLATAPQLVSMWELFVKNLNEVPEGRNMFTPDPWCANFLNGTLKVTRTATGYSSAFHPHRDTDYLVNVLPLNYTESRGTSNPVFDEMLGRFFEGDVDYVEKRRAVAQMYGACLLPAFAHLFMLNGPPGTGKSTVIKLAVRLVDQANTSSVQPCDFVKFGMSSMAGKLVNYDTDIAINRPIEDSVVKKIEDRIVFRIERKNRDDIYAPLPSVHIFGGNGIPPTLEGSSRAHDRRWTFIGFNKVLTGGGDHDLAYAEKCWDAGPDGILAFALAGLADLLASKGHFFNPQSGKEKMETWQMSNDPVGQFLSAVDHGEVLDGNSFMFRENGAEILRSKAYSCFKVWSQSLSFNDRVLSAIRFYERMEGHGFKHVRNSQGRYFVGLQIGARAGAHH